MAKNIHHSLYVLFLLCVVHCSFSQSSVAHTAPTGTTCHPSASAACIEHSMLSQVGVRELTNHNDGPQVEMYLHTCSLCKGYAWCAAFVKWCYTQCGIDTRAITAWAASTINWQHVIYTAGKFRAEPQVGDNITFWDYYNRRVAHTGLYHRRINETIYESVEGNTNEGGSSEGDGVYVKKRSYRATYVISRWLE